MKDEEKIKNTKVNALKRAAHTNKRAKSFAKLVTNLPNDTMTSKEPSTSIHTPPPPSTPLPLNQHHKGTLSANFRKDG